MYKTIYADPPWKFNDTLGEKRKLPYKTMTIDEIKELPIKDIVDDEAHLYLWTTHSHLQEGLDIINEWGFDYKTVLVWDKKTKHGKDAFGLGHYFRESRELCLFSTKNGLKTRCNGTRDIFSAKMPERHSGKPDKMYEIIEKNSYPPYLELFATKKRKGWDAWGAKVTDDIDLGV